MKELVGIPPCKFIAGLFIAVLTFCALSSAVCPNARAANTWSKTYGGTGDDSAHGDVFQTSDGGYAVSGDTNSFGAGGLDFWLIKVDAAGNMQWNKTYGGNGNDACNTMSQTSDGGYALMGSTTSFGAGSNDLWLVKTDASGNMQWNKTYGGTRDDQGYRAVQTNDGGYAVAGSTTSSGAGFVDGWLIKTDSTGNMQWNKTYGAAGVDYSFELVATPDGGYALGGVTTSYGAGAMDYWLVKTDAAGTVQWNKTYGGTGVELLLYLVRTSDGGYAMAGPTTSFGAGGQDYWLVKTDASGNMQWNKTYGGTGADMGWDVVQTSDGGYALAGYTSSFGAGGQDFWLVKTDAAGNMQWNQTYGGKANDAAYCLTQASDEGYVLTGQTASFGAGGQDAWLVKTDGAGAPLPPPPAASAFGSVTVLLGWTWNFFVHSNGGVGAHTYQWYEGTTLLTGQTSMVLSVTKTAPGTYTYYCKVTDAEGKTANSNTVTLTVIG